MQIKVTRIEDGPARVEVIDPSDGAVTHTLDVNVGEQVAITATTATSPADITVGEVETTPEVAPEPEGAEAGEQAEAEGSGSEAEAEPGEGAAA